MPWKERPEELPLDVEEVRTALWMESGNVTKAAATLRTTSLRLRNFIRRSPRLTEELNECQQQLVDIGIDNVYDALVDSEDKGRRDTMSRFVLQTLGKERGFGTSSAKIDLRLPKGKVSISWSDGTSISAGEDDAKVIEHE